MKNIKLAVLSAFLLSGTIISADPKIDFLDGCILQITGEHGEKLFVDISTINSIAVDGEKDKVIIRDREYLSHLNNEQMKTILNQAFLKEWLRCKAAINK